MKDAAPITPGMIRAALREDAPKGDITSRATIPASAVCRAKLVAKQGFTLCGIGVFAQTFAHATSRARVTARFRDGARISKGAVIATVTGPARAILTAERVALNYLQRMSAVATHTRRFTDAVAGTDAVILDTRKTLPGWRDLDKYSVRMGGGQNHRRDLSEMALIKENHIAVAGGIGSAVARARAAISKGIMIEVETTCEREIKEALMAGTDRIMFDNMTPPQVRRGVNLVAGRAETEASGNMNLNNIRAYARTGVDFISVGSLTNSPPAVDVSLLVEIKTRPR